MNRAVYGFTLLELLIAMAVFAIMATMAYGGLKTVIDTQQYTAERAAQIRELQLALYQLNEDLLQAVSRPVRDELGGAELAFWGGNSTELLTLTRSVPDLLSGRERSQLQRVSYRFESGALYRVVWSTLDRTQQSKPVRRRLLNAASVEIRFFAGEWTSAWPAAGAAIPIAVEIVFGLDRLGEIRRGFYLS